MCFHLNALLWTEFYQTHPKSYFVQPQKPKFRPILEIQFYQACLASAVKLGHLMALLGNKSLCHQIEIVMVLFMLTTGVAIPQ